MSKTIILSNRLPLQITITKGKLQVTPSVGGLATGLKSFHREGDSIWIGWSGLTEEETPENLKAEIKNKAKEDACITVDFSEEEMEGFYYGFSNRSIWPLFHYFTEYTEWESWQWDMYKKVNQKFCENVLEELPKKSPFIFIQDYHFTLLPKMLKEKRPDATIALFWHIPWPNPENFLICPYQEEILNGMLGSDLIGFHVQNHCNNFLDTANRLLESRVDTEKFCVIRHRKETYVRAFPISIDGYIDKIKSNSKIIREVEKIKEEFYLKDKIVGVGVDRIDYTKGIIERILAIDKFLEKYPQYKKKFVFIQLAAPSRTHIKRYHQLIGEIDELVEKKNWKHLDENWKPIIYLKGHFSQEEIEPYYLIANFCIVSSLHDGMNLVAKEYVAAKKDLSGSLILSQFTGAARELKDAIQINPYHIEEFADAIKIAIEMPIGEKRKRMENMRKIIRENNVYRWAANIIGELVALKKM
ncbi:MAG: trehalose-6-phosphate synthase [Candidatus Omnitrophica bacterium]|nr:trehalose-6-phosphate synthase [Candidatus Omnitrophota bacterium]